MSERRFNLDNYIDVQERINRFWEDHPEGAIRTNLMSDPLDFSQCRYKAEVFKQFRSDHPDAIGWAFEIAGGGGANRTSHEENCETSAIGRALANMGYATSREDRPSKQEITKAARSEPVQIGAAPKSTVSQMKALHAEAANRGLDHDDVHALAGLKHFDSITEMSADDMDSLKEWLQKARPAELDVQLKRAGRRTMDERLSDKHGRSG